MRSVLAIGCDKYSHLAQLTGAESDATRIWDVLTGEGVGSYPAENSCLLASPLLVEVWEALRAFSPEPGGLDVLTIYFAGHGAEKGGSYFLCVSDTDPLKLSTTALPLAALLAVLSELQPAQAHLIIDACQAGGGMYDFPNVLKREALGPHESMGISVLAACGVQEYAAETCAGGMATQYLLELLDGSEVLQTNRPFLDLIDVGRSTSASVMLDTEDQTPVAWGINLRGESRFATNPAFELGVDKEASGGDPAEGRSHALSDELTERLWQAHKWAAQEIVPRELVLLLEDVWTAAADDAPTSFLRGVATSLQSAASQSSDLLAESQVIDCVAAVLLNRPSTAGVPELLEDLLEGRRRLWEPTIGALEELLGSDAYSLVSPGHPLADLFYLPLRTTNLLAWLASHLIAEELLGEDAALGLERTRDLVRRILDRYGNSIVPLSDSQAPAAYVFAILCRRHGWVEEAEEFLGRLFFELTSSGGAVARVDARPTQLLEYLRFRLDPGTRPNPRLLANPSSLVTTTLHCGAIHALDEVWDPDMIDLDHQACNVFIPETFQDFGRLRIGAGTNHTFAVGEGVWTLADVRDFIATRRDAVVTAGRNMSDSQRVAALFSALLLQDRIPLFVEP